MPKSALIAGSTGLVGSDCLQFLLASPEYASVTALVRKGSGISHPKLLEQLVDFESLGNFPGSDDVFCALGTTIKKAGSQPAFRRVDLEYPLLLAERSLTAGAKQFLPKIKEAKDNKWIDAFLAYRDDFEFAPAAHEVMEAFAALRAKQEKPAKKIFNEASAAFQQNNKDAGYAKYQEIVDKYFASSFYRNVKRWLADRK